MKNKASVFLLILCVLLCAALAVSVLSLRSARSDVAQLEAQLLELAEEKAQLDNLNQTLRFQLDSYFLSQSGSNVYIEEDYGSLMVNSWSVTDGVLAVDALAEVFLTAPADFTASIELWRGEAVVASQPVTLNPTEADTVFEAELSVSFALPRIADGEELQLCLMVQPAAGDAFFAYGAGWYPENGELAIITG